MPTVLAEIKEKLDAHIGDVVTLTTHESRHRNIEHQAVVRETFHSVFVLDLKRDGDQFDRASYSYTDVLTNNIELAF
ncbi:Veg family protein [Weissella diestrammenae]|uniref:Veg family protein n=1 Tax=Weissella diestrammenae TaxID=1162633 RepID=A0A7G9T7A2_9LACO|nr:Veg family protein [Weissella diestrammenae]MCM0581987.1 Veg family protein [Weissella diestrammenae]QNN75977.1 Veg family protein [Weissella diestrammenae]